MVSQLYGAKDWENLSFYKTAQEIWEVVQEIYSNMENIAQSFQIHSTIRTTRQGNNSVTEYYNALTELWQEMICFMKLNGSVLEMERSKKR